MSDGYDWGATLKQYGMVDTDPAYVQQEYERFAAKNPGVTPQEWAQGAFGRTQQAFGGGSAGGGGYQTQGGPASDFAPGGRFYNGSQQGYGGNTPGVARPDIVSGATAGGYTQGGGGYQRNKPGVGNPDPYNQRQGQAGPGPNVPPTGLIGSEAALLQGLGGAEGALMGGLGWGLGMLDQGMARGRGDINQQLQGGLRDMRGGLSGGNRYFNMGADALQGAQAGIDGLFEKGVGAGNQYFDKGAGAFQPWIGAGQAAHQRQAALSGAQGADAQKAAMQGFMESPYMAHLKEQGNRAVTRNAAAMGGLGSGNVMKELTRFGTGIAAQDFDNQFNRLGQVGNRGMQAAQGLGALRGQQGTMNANMRAQQAGLQGNMANALAGLRSNQGQFQGNMAQGMAGLRANAGSQLGNMAFQGGITGANMAQNTATGIGAARMNTGNNLAIGRTNAGNAIAENVAGTTSSLSDLINQQGQGLSDLTGGGASQIGQLLLNSGMLQGASDEQLAQLLAQLGISSAGTYNSVPGMPGIEELDGNLENIGNAISAGAMLFSDARLKTNIRKVGETAGGTNIYEWEWNALGRRTAGNAPTVGVLAHEVPGAASLGADGFLRVDYTRIN